MHLHASNVLTSTNRYYPESTGKRKCRRICLKFHVYFSELTKHWKEWHTDCIRMYEVKFAFFQKVEWKFNYSKKKKSQQNGINYFITLKWHWMVWIRQSLNSNVKLEVEFAQKKMLVLFPLNNTKIICINQYKFSKLSAI